MFSPERLSNRREFFLNQSRGSTLVGIKKLGYFGVRVRFEQDVNMIAIVIPFQQGNVITRAYVRKYVFQAVGYGFIDDVATIFDDKNQVIKK